MKSSFENCILVRPLVLVDCPHQSLLFLTNQFHPFKAWCWAYMPLPWTHTWTSLVLSQWRIQIVWRQCRLETFFVEPIWSNYLILCLTHDMHATWHALGALREQGATTIDQPCLTCSWNLSQLFVGVFWACSYVFYQ